MKDYIIQVKSGPASDFGTFHWADKGYPTIAEAREMETRVAATYGFETRVVMRTIKLTEVKGG